MENLKSLGKIIQKNWKVKGLLLFSLFVKWFYFTYNQGPLGPDAIEYLDASAIFKSVGIGYLWNDSPTTFWRLPVYPLVIALTYNLTILAIFQLGLTYVISLNIWSSLLKIGFNEKASLGGALAVLFLPYINISARGVGPELLQVLFFSIILQKVLYNKKDLWLAIVLSLLSLMRPEGFIIVVFLFIREIWFRNYRNIVLFLWPFAIILGWQYRNYQLFDSFSSINPIHPSRSMIGSIYSAIYVDVPHPFHKSYNYYEGKDYVHKKEFVSTYKSVVAAELKKYIMNNPFGYLKHRIERVLKCFSYLSFSSERLPDKNWRIKNTDNWDEVVKINAEWSYKSLIEAKDYFRLALRISYHLFFCTAHFIGLFVILYHFRRFSVWIFILLSFGYVFLVEADMRYFIFPQIMCFSGLMAIIIEKISFKMMNRDLP